MKKYIAFTVITFGLAGSILAMEGEEILQEQEQSGFGVFELFGDVSTFFSRVSEDITGMASVFNTDQRNEQNQEQQEEYQVATKLVRQELANKTLSEAIMDSTRQGNPNKFLTLLIGMKELDIHTDQKSKTIISNYLGILQSQHSEKTKAILTKRMAKAQELHALRKQFTVDSTLSDDEEYADLNKFTRKLLSN